MQRRLAMLVVGDTAREEFAGVPELLGRYGDVELAADLAAVDKRIGSPGYSPDMVVLAQSYPGQFAPRAVETLRRRLPLARIVGLLGSWCEGEARTGEPWPAVPRVYWHQWRPRVERELPRIVAGAGTSWELPSTASEEERLLAVSPVDWPLGAGLVAVWTRRFEIAGLLVDLLCGAGYGAVWLEPARPPRLAGVAAALFDGDDLRGPGREELTRLVRSVCPAPVVALLDFPRTDDVAAARDAGAAAVVSKPFLLDELLSELARALRPPR